MVDSTRSLFSMFVTRNLRGQRVNSVLMKTMSLEGTHDKWSKGKHWRRGGKKKYGSSLEMKQNNIWISLWSGERST